MSDVPIMTFEAYSEQWKVRHRGSVPRKQKTSSAQEYFWIGFWIAVAISAAIFSAAHTIPAAEMTFFRDNPNRSQLALTAFVMVELVIFGAAAGRQKYRLLAYLLMGALLVALAGNVSSTMAAVMINGGNVLTQFGGVLLALLAPLTALVAGEVVHRELDTLAEKRKAAQLEYEAAWREMEAKINAAYTKYLKEREPRPVVSVQTVQRPIGHGQGYSRESKATTLVREHLEATPSDAALSVRELADKLNVGKSTVANVLREMRTEQEHAAVNGQLPTATTGVVYSNGKHESEGA